MQIIDDVVLQAKQCMKNIVTVLKDADATLEDVVRVTYILPNAVDFENCCPVLRQYFGNVRPAATIYAAGLVDPNMKI